MSKEDLHEKIREEIRKRVIEQEFLNQEEKAAAEKTEALLEALQSITDLPPEEIKRIADETRAQFLAERTKPKKRAGGLKMIGAILGFALCLTIGVFLLISEEKPRERYPRTEEKIQTVEEIERKPRSGSENREQSTEPTSGSETMIHVSIGEDRFWPVGMKMRVGGQAVVFFSKDRPEAVARVPEFRGEEQKFGALRLGLLENDRFHFAFDLLPDGRPLMYIDINQNGDLTDDGSPKVNEGSGWFATAVWIPFDQLIDAVQLPGKYRTWLFMTENQWDAGVFRRYSWTQLQGSVTIAGKEYDAFIADSQEHDADYTNDGIGVDLNRNGKIDYDAELFPPRSVARIDGRKYVFEIGW